MKIKFLNLSAIHGQASRSQPLTTASRHYFQSMDPELQRQLACGFGECISRRQTRIIAAEDVLSDPSVLELPVEANTTVPETDSDMSDQDENNNDVK